MKLDMIMEKSTIKGICDGIISAIPLVGNIQAGIQSAENDKYLEELEKWKEMVVDMLLSLKMDLSKIKGDNFKFILTESVPVAVVNNDGKRKYLLGSIRYAANKILHEDKWQIFVQYFNKYTPSHFMYLIFLKKYKEVNPGSCIKINDYESRLSLFCEENNLDKTIMDLIKKELIDDGLLREDDFAEYNGNDFETLLDFTEVGRDFIEVFNVC